MGGNSRFRSDYLMMHAETVDRLRSVGVSVFAIRSACIEILGR